jgi:hypothetical protein
VITTHRTAADQAAADTDDVKRLIETLTVLTAEGQNRMERSDEA